MVLCQVCTFVGYETYSKVHVRELMCASDEEVICHTFQSLLSLALHFIKKLT